MGLSDRTKTLPASGELPSTKVDMEKLYEWEFGDPEPKGTFARNNAPMRRYRQDLKRGKAKASSYKHNVIYVDTLKPVSEQLEELNK